MKNAKVLKEITCICSYLSDGPFAISVASMCGKEY